MSLPGTCRGNCRSQDARMAIRSPSRNCAQYVSAPKLTALHHGPSMSTEEYSVSPHQGAARGTTRPPKPTISCIWLMGFLSYSRRIRGLPGGNRESQNRGSITLKELRVVLFSSISVYYCSPICWARAHFSFEVDEFVPRAEHVNLSKVGQPSRGWPFHPRQGTARGATLASQSGSNPDLGFSISVWQASNSMLAALKSQKPDTRYSPLRRAGVCDSRMSDAARGLLFDPLHRAALALASSPGHVTSAHTSLLAFRGFTRLEITYKGTSLIRNSDP